MRGMLPRIFRRLAGRKKGTHSESKGSVLTGQEIFEAPCECADDSGARGRRGTIAGHKVIVVGGGPAGMMAALSAARKNAQVTLYDKMEELGKKLCITGKGRCNLTHQVESPKELIEYYPGGGNFLYSAFSQFSPHDLMEFFGKKGLSCKVERGKRVFPSTDRAEDVLGVLLSEMKKAGVEVMPDTPVIEVIQDKGRISGVKIISGERISSDKVIISTGGMTYPWTGSTGDGYNFAKKLGHAIIPPRPSLVPLEVGETAVCHNLEGLSLRNVKATLKYDNKVIDHKFGEMVFTSYGLSGPIILFLSRKVALLLANKKGTVTMQLDLKPALSADKLRSRLENDFEKFRKKFYKNSLEDLLPSKMIPVFTSLSGISPTKQCAQINQKEKDRIIDLLKSLTFTITKTRGMTEAEVTQGGIELKEVDPKTMESKVIPGLYFAGEILDVDGYIGGYNLQAAFSTGYVAGICSSQ
jgi:predicted Rossmann fold flavoprotein